jgi:hypothetical protein
VVKRLADNPEGITLGLCYLELQGLALQYKQRRDLFVDCLAEAFQLQLTSENEGVRGCDIYLVFHKPRSGFTEFSSEKLTSMFSFVPPTSGMFVLGMWTGCFRLAHGLTLRYSLLKVREPWK